MASEQIVKVFEAPCFGDAVEVEDGGRAMIVAIDDGQDDGMFVNVQSWDEQKHHKDLRSFVGKRVRVTIETIE